MSGNRWPRFFALLAFCCLASAAFGQANRSRDVAMVVEARNAVTNALLGRVADRRATRDVGRQSETTATNI